MANDGNILQKANDGNVLQKANDGNVLSEYQKHGNGFWKIMIYMLCYYWVLLCITVRVESNMCNMRMFHNIRPRLKRTIAGE